MIIKLLKNCNPADVHISNCTFLRNIAESEGAGISIYEITYLRVINMISIVNDTVFEGGSAGTVGGGISYTTTVASVPTQILTEHDLTYALKSFQLSRTSFSGNTAGVYAGALLCFTSTTDQKVGTSLVGVEVL